MDILNLLKLSKFQRGVFYSAGVITGIVGACIFHKENKKPTKTQEDVVGKIVVNPIDGQLTIMLGKDPAEIKPGRYTILVVQQEDFSDSDDINVN